MKASKKVLSVVCLPRRREGGRRARAGGGGMGHKRVEHFIVRLAIACEGERGDYRLLLHDQYKTNLDRF
jgi:hypothetical protein